MLNNVIKSISIVGCGWLGLPLAKFLITKGYLVKGSTTSLVKLESLKNAGIVPFLLHLNPAISGNNTNQFFDSDLIIINIPPGRNTFVDDYVQKMNHLNDAIIDSRIKKVIFISSTSVYTETNSWVDEDTEVDKKSIKGLRMFTAEQVFVCNPKLQTTVIRMAGLIGPNRHPGRFFGGKQDIADGLSPVNLIHLTDCLNLISAVIEQNFWNKTINGVAPSHPTKQDFYTLASRKFNNSKADFISQTGNFKKVRCKFSFEEFGYKYKIDDLLGWVNETNL
ncbi:MAG: SDR family NAD(P)-dependent oxidoreductase [Sphingobacteriales bacterium]|nr:MAG: SDR family NAD(P)-dependent oxidoreductase [Sphingobacteriales bacterium]